MSAQGTPRAEFVASDGTRPDFAVTKSVSLEAGDQDVTALVEERVAAVTGTARMDLNLLALAGLEREQALARAEEALDAVIDIVIDAGDDANIAVAARLAGVSRDLIYARLNARRATA